MFLYELIFVFIVSNKSFTLIIKTFTNWLETIIVFTAMQKRLIHVWGQTITDTVSVSTFGLFCYVSSLVSIEMFYCVNIDVLFNLVFRITMEVYNQHHTNFHFLNILDKINISPNHIFKLCLKTSVSYFQSRNDSILFLVKNNGYENSEYICNVLLLQFLAFVVWFDCFTIDWSFGIVFTITILLESKTYTHTIFVSLF